MMGPDCCCCRHACVLLSFVLKLDMVARNYLIDLPKNGKKEGEEEGAMYGDAMCGDTNRKSR